MEWLRWYHGAVSDDKWPLIARKSGQTVAVVIAVWAALLECASQSEVRGSVHDFDPESIDALMQLPDGATQAVVDALSAGMRPRIMDGKIANWSKRQPVRERDDDKSTERVRQHRERQKALQNKDNAPGNAEETPVKRQETPRTEKIREEKNIKAPPYPPEGGTGDGESSPTSPASKSKAREPTGNSLPELRQAVAADVEPRDHGGPADLHRLAGGVADVEIAIGLRIAQLAPLEGVVGGVGGLGRILDLDDVRHGGSPQG